MPRLKTAIRLMLAGFFIFAGVSHFLRPQFFLNIVPPYLPWHRALVYVSGGAEIGLGALLLVRQFASVARWGLIALLVAVFPANVHMALNPERYPSISPLALWLRLPLQPLVIALVYWVTRASSRRD